jgi:hypothetical protein
MELISLLMEKAEKHMSSISNNAGAMQNVQYLGLKNILGTPHASQG